MKDSIPDFVIMGAMKCGTTSLYHYLRNHPDIFMPKEKELDFFIEESNFNRGLNWYKSKFDPDSKINGEASPNYSKVHLYPKLPERMYKYIPNVKLIYMYRNPVERTYSHYLHNLAVGEEKKSLEKALTPDSNYVMTSKYYYQLDHFLQFFDRKQLLVLSADNLRNHRRDSLEVIYNFLGVRFFYDQKDFNKELHKSDRKTKRSAISNFILNTSFGKYLNYMLPEEFKQLYKNAFEKELKKPKLTSELQDTLKMYFEEDQKLFNKHILNR